jgi:hypothetical protein
MRNSHRTDEDSGDGDSHVLNLRDFGFRACIWSTYVLPNKRIRQLNTGAKASLILALRIPNPKGRKIYNSTDDDICK